MGQLTRNALVSARGSDVVTVSYVGAAGRKLTRYDIYLAPNPNFDGEFDILRNGASSNYAAVPGAALVHLGPCHRQCLLGRQLCERAARGVFGSRLFRLRYPADILGRDFV